MAKRDKEFEARMQGMRLIDANSLKEISEIQMADFNSIEGIRAWIDKQPTAYDVEKVIEKLELEQKNEVNAGVCPSGLFHFLTAINIVKEGGVAHE